jgi:hypothetical protein
MFSTNASQVSTAANYIEDVFSTYLYKGNSSTQTITNGIDLSTKGGLVWIKDRTFGNSHQLYDTARGVQKRLMSDSTSAQGTETTGITAFNTTGWTMGAQYEINDSASNYASWTFRKQAKFFDVVTYTGNGTAGRTVAHNLGSVPGCIIVKATSAANDWLVYHTSLGNTQGMSISSTSPATTSTTYWNNTSPTSTEFTVGSSPRSNENGTTFVAYIFAHNAGGFGLTGNDNVISCGFITGTGAVQDINLGYEPQWVLLKRTDSTGDWTLIDNMRGFTADGLSTRLYPNLSNAEGATTQIAPTATGFRYVATNGINTSGATGIYIAIRRGPMKVPTSGTSVFAPDAGTNGTNGGIVPTAFPVDVAMTAYRSLGGVAQTIDKLRGIGQTNTTNVAPLLVTSDNLSEAANAGGNAIFYNAWNNSITRGSNGANPGGLGIITWFFRRAPGFFDEVCYTGTGVLGRSVTHNLTTVPEMMIVKSRSKADAWMVYDKDFPGSPSFSLSLNSSAGSNQGSAEWGNTTPTASVFYVGGATAQTNDSGETYVAYLFATCPGVSKVGSYTGTGATQTINCGFTGGARFVLIKRTDSSGDWYVWDTARGMVAGTDPSLLLNSAAAEVNANSVYTTGVGFQIVSTAAGINASGGSYIFLAIA